MLRPGHGLMLITIALLSIGVVMVNSAGLRVGSGEPLTLSHVLLGRPALLAYLAIGLLLVASRLPIRWLATARGAASPVPWIAAGSIALLLAVHVPGVGREVNGARRWIEIGGLGFQPSEVAKWGVLFVLAWYGSRRAEAMARLREGFLAPMAFLGTVCVLIATEDLGTAILIGAASVVMLLAAGARLAHVAMLAPAAALAFVAAVLTSPYRMDRLRAFLDPYQDPQGIGYHVLQSMAAVAGGGLSGRGIGGGVQKFGYLPEDTTDFVFAIIAEELGVAGSALVLGLFAALLLCGLAVVRDLRNPHHRLLGLGILLTIGFQTLLNTLVVTGLVPTKGIALPLVSSGGTGWCLTAFALGLLVAMERETLRLPAAGEIATAERLGEGRDRPTVSSRYRVAHE